MDGRGTAVTGHHHWCFPELVIDLESFTPSFWFQIKFWSDNIPPGSQPTHPFALDFSGFPSAPLTLPNGAVLRFTYCDILWFMMRNTHLVFILFWAQNS